MAFRPNFVEVYYQRWRSEHLFCFQGLLLKFQRSLQVNLEYSPAKAIISESLVVADG